MKIRALVLTAVTAALLVHTTSPASAQDWDASDIDSSSPVAMAQVPTDWMQDAYYGCNPWPHSEKAYKRTDTSPPVASVPTIVGARGEILVLVTTIYNRNPSGTAEYAVIGNDGRELRRSTQPRPGVERLSGFTPGSRVFIQPRTMGTMAKILTPEQLSGCGVTVPSGI